MAKLDVYLDTFRPHEAVTLHAWDDAGDVRDVDGAKVSPGSYKFSFEMDAPDVSRISLKFRFPRESPEWEKDDYVRRVPSSGIRDLWTAELSARCMTTDPRSIPPASTGAVVTIGAVTSRRFAGGELFAWDPASGRSLRCPQARRDETRNLSFFHVSLQQWMTSGFHFKLARGDDFEPEKVNRFWRPGDGERIFIKSGEVDVRTAEPALVDVLMSVIVPAVLAPSAAIGVRDAVDDFATDATRTGSVKLDDEFVAVECTARLYRDALYLVTPRVERSTGAESYTPQWSLPLRVEAQGDPAPRHTLLGVSEWYPTRPVRDATVELRIHPNPSTTFGAAVEAPWHLGFARRTEDETPSPACGRVLAQRGGDGTWSGRLRAFGGVPTWIGTVRSGAAVETRPDGPTLSQRELRPKGGTRTTVHTVDGQTGLSRVPPDASLFEDVDPAARRRLMQSAFSPSIVDAGVFAPHEMPHGATWHEEALWFVVAAPHATSASLLLLDRARSATGRNVTTIAMKLTPDLRYWWCEVARNRFPDQARIEYRFLLDGATEVLDPASRQASPADYLWAGPGEGIEGAWSIAVDRTELAKAAVSPGWQTPFWNEFMIYELHARRFTDRNRRNGVPLPPLEQIQSELGRYLGALPVTALEFLPTSEFPKNISWGYNASLIFAVESSYGGPMAMSSLVRSSHAAGKAVLLDLVFNHLSDSPMQATAKDVFANGWTPWGDMVNYDHPACQEFFRQALVYLYDTFQVDGFRFDATEAIVNGHRPENTGVVSGGRAGSGGGWKFLEMLHEALDRSANAAGRRLPYAIAENNPTNWPMDGVVVDGQWDFDFQGKVGWAAARDGGDAASELAGLLMTWRRAEEMVNFAESHDSCSAEAPRSLRIAARGPWGSGLRMAKACGALALLAKGVPMMFMGSEAAETTPFTLDESQSAVLPLDAYEKETENAHVLSWYRDLLGLRKNWANGLAGNDTPYVGKGHRTIAFTRDGGRFFVIVTLGTSDRRQDLGWMGLPAGASYKEVFNSTWPKYHVSEDDWSDNGGYGAHLAGGAIANLPEIGAVVLERV